MLGLSRYPLAILIFAVVASAPFSVTDALAVMNGVLFGPWVGSLVNAAGIVVAAVIGYAVAIRTSKLLDIESTVQRLPNWVRHFKIGSPMFLIVVRIIPGLGGTIATQTAAALRVPIWRQIYTMSAIAIPFAPRSPSAATRSPTTSTTSRPAPTLMQNGITCTFRTVIVMQPRSRCPPVTQ